MANIPSYQNPTFGTVTFKTNVEDNSAEKVLVQNSLGKLNWIYKNSLIPDNFTKVVYVNNNNPNGATIFDLNNPPVTNDNLLKSDVNNLYIGTDASTWVYNATTVNYVTKTVTSNTSNFYLAGTTTDAGNNKTAAIERTGPVGVGTAIASNHAVTKAQHDTKGDMTTNTNQIVSGVKTFLAGMFGLRNTANTFTSFFASAVTASRTWTLRDRNGILADDTDLALKQNIALNIQAVTSSATVTPTSSNDMVVITAQAVNLTLANPTGTFQQGQSLIIRIKDNGTTRTITFGSNYRIIGSILPTATVVSKIIYIGIVYNSTDSKWDVVAIKTEN